MYNLIKLYISINNTNILILIILIYININNTSIYY